jgi:hypothetical protein
MPMGRKRETAPAYASVRPAKQACAAEKHQQKGNLPLWGIFVVVSMMSLIMGLLMLVLVFIRAQGFSSRFISTPANR